MRKKTFAVAILDLKYEAFIIHIASIVSSSSDLVYPFYWAQIILLKAGKAFTEILSKYAGFIDIFSSDLVVEHLEHTKINNYAIQLIDCMQLSYDPIYSLEPVKLKIFKTYIETNLVNGFIEPFNCLTDTPILFFGNLIAAFAYRSIT